MPTEPAAPSAIVQAVVSVQSPPDLRGNNVGLFATFSALPPPTGEFSLWVPPNDVQGCSPYSARVAGVHAALVRRGTCTFVNKTLNAQRAGAAGIVVIGDGNQLQLMGGNSTEEDSQVKTFAVGIAKKLGEQLLQRLSNNERATFTLQVYEPSLLDLSEVLLICLATLLVAAGAFFSTADLRQGSPIAPRRDEVVELSIEIAVSFCVAGSAMLMVLFFFMRYMIYFIIFAFALGGASCITQFGSMCLQHLVPPLRHKAVSLPVFGSVARAELVSSVPAIVLVGLWLRFRNEPQGWFFQDIIGAGFLCWLQRTLRLPSMKVATLLLSVMFFFDVFWVFISPALFRGKSVMVEVATGGGTGESVPMLLRIPAIGDAFGRDRMLGFGDVALPGLLVSFLRRYDLLARKRFFGGYFAPSLLGYFVGLSVTIVALFIMRMGQPALLYLVPGTLGTTLVLAKKRGELPSLWEGTPANQEDSGNHKGNTASCDHHEECS